MRLSVAIALLFTSVLIAACSGDSDGRTATPSDIDAQLSELAGKSSRQQAKIEYTLSGAGAGSGTVTFFWKSKETWRADLHLSDSEGTLITAEGKTYACAILDGQGQCQETGAGVSPLPLLAFFTDQDSFKDLIDTETAGIDFTRSERQIAEQQVVCFSGEGEISNQQGSAEYCFSDAGLLLRLAGGTPAGTLELEATAVSDQVTDSDFKLPYPSDEQP